MQEAMDVPHSSVRRRQQLANIDRRPTAPSPRQRESTSTHGDHATMRPCDHTDSLMTSIDQLSMPMTSHSPLSPRIRLTRTD